MPHLTAEAAERATSVLQENHEKWDIFFNDSGFHSELSWFYSVEKERCFCGLGLFGGGI